MSEIVGESRHLRAVGIADEKRRRSSQDRHRDNDRMAANGARGVGNVGQAAHRAGWRRCAGAKARAVARVHQPEQQRQIENRVQKNPIGRPEREQDEPAGRRSHQHPEIARRGVEPDCAHQIGGPDDVVEQHLYRRKPQHAGAAVNHQERHRLPHLQGASDEEIAPAGPG